jgi:hypothetical protein
MYIIPQQYRCPKCAFVCKWGPHDSFDAPVLKGGPACPRCWLEFISSAVPEMKRHDGDH